jgi:DNA phosphorothioation-associated putative methyltransferase
MEWTAARGRLPEPDAFQDAAAIFTEFGSIKRAFALIRRVTGSEDWETIRKKRIEDLLIHLLLGKFRRRPRLSKLSVPIRRDIRALFGTYKRGSEQADQLLLQAGDTDAIDEACKRFPTGKLLPNALYIHRSSLDNLEPLLRIYEGCARAYVREIERANIIKIHRFSGELSYLIYSDFDSDPHPTLLRCVKLSMRSLDLNCYDDANSENPRVLHLKEVFLNEDQPLRDKFARLTRQAERHGLLTDTSAIETRAGWDARLVDRGFQLARHRLIRQKSGT